MTEDDTNCNQIYDHLTSNRSVLLHGPGGTGGHDVHDPRWQNDGADSHVEGEEEQRWTLESTGEVSRHHQRPHALLRQQLRQSVQRFHAAHRSEILRIAR